MRVVVIGGKGHIGTYLVPKLVELGHEVIVISRGQREPYQPHGAWAFVKIVQMDRKVEEEAGQFGEKILKLKPDVVMDLICFTPSSVQEIVKALKGNIQHYLFCGSLWVHGYSTRAAAVESQPKDPFGEYGKNKLAIENYLLDLAKREGFPATILHPGHIVGKGWVPLNPAGHFNPKVYEVLAKGEELALPHFGMETVHHVHADDVAQTFVNSMNHWSQSVGEAFHVGSPYAITLRGYAEAVAGWFGKKANLKFLSWEDFQKTVTPDEAKATCDHIAHCPNASIEKARKLIDYQPRYTSLEAVYESVQWLIANKRIQVN